MTKITFITPSLKRSALSLFLLSLCIVTGQKSLSAEPKPPLPVTKKWSIEPVCKEFGDDSLRLHSIRIQQEKIWISIRDTGQKSFVSYDPPKWIIRCLDAGTMTTISTFKGNLEKETAITGRIFDVYGDYLYVVLSQNKMRQIDLRTKTEKDIPILIPNNATINLTAHKTGVFIGTSDRLLNIDADTGKITILASQRRRPIANELDNRGWHPYPNLISVTSTNAVFSFCTLQEIAIGQVDLKTGLWKLIVHKYNGKFLASGENVLGDGDGDLYRWNGLTTNLALRPLLNGSNEDTAWWEFSPEMPVTHGYPGDLRGAGISASFDGKNLWLLTPAARWKNTGGLPSAILIPMPDREATLWLYDDKSRLPLEIPLKLQSSPLTFTPFFKPIITAHEDGLLISTPAFQVHEKEYSSFWYVPATAIKAWLAENEKHQHLPARKADILRAKYDRNLNGVLDPDELADWQKDPENLEKQKNKEFEDFIRNHDRNDNHVLDKNEIPAFDPFLTIRNGNAFMRLPIDELFELCDTNKDGKLDIDELKRLKTTDFNQRPSIPQSLKRFDVNNNGKLDPEEKEAIRKFREQNSK